MKKLIINSKSQMAELATNLAKKAQVGDIFLLKGTLGVGKSFFAKKFIESLLEEKTEILSPTFNLVYSYNSLKGKINHFDLYRLKQASELENIGFFDTIGKEIALIEWPEIASDFLPENCCEIEIKISEGGEEFREVTINDRR
jgi:tRNA threonylcarbamoyl adenosine modification protein YjeE